MELIKAIQSNNLEEAIKKIETDRFLVNFKDSSNSNRTPLHYACHLGFIDIVKELLKSTLINVC
jgi:hypothetical protein